MVSLTRRVASGCYLCAGDDYVVLLGSPTGSITLVSSLREIPTAVVLHHPFSLGKYRRSLSRHHPAPPEEPNMSTPVDLVSASSPVGLVKNFYFYLLSFLFLLL